MSENKPDLMAELAEVVRLDRVAELRKGACDEAFAIEQRDEAAVNFLRTHHAELEAVVRDAARYRWLCDKFGVTKLPCAIERIVDRTYVADGKAAIDEAIDQAMHNSAREG